MTPLATLAPRAEAVGRDRHGLEIVPAVCPHDCTSTCALEVERLDAHRIGRVRGSARNTYTRGVICEKVARYAERTHHPDRLMHPLLRVGPKGSGQFARISWDEALDRVAQAFTEQAARLGPETVWPYYYAGTMGLVQRDGINRLRHAMRYSRYFSTICVTLADTGWIAGTGAKRGADLREVGEHSDLVVIWGGNPVNTQVNVMTHVMAARRRGATLVVVDPYRTGTAEQADLHLAVRPGTDGALACAVMHVLFREGFADWDYLRRYTDCPDALAAHVGTRTPEWAAAITGLPVAEIVGFARLYGRTRRSFIRCHHGFSRSRNGAANMHAVSCLPAVTGAWQYPGGGAVYGHTGIYPIDRTLIEGLDVVDRSIRLLDQSRLGAILTGDPEALAGGPPVTAMLVQNTNPAMVCPDLHRVHAGLAREDLFLCVHEQFLTETARFADVVLPATTFVEHDDFYIASGHTTFQVSRKVIEPPGECRENHDVICALARRLGARHPGFEMTAWEIMDRTLRQSGMWDAETNWRRGGQDCAPPWETAHFLDGFETPDHKFHFRADWARFGGRWREMPSLPDHFDVIDGPTPERPFRLVAAPARTFLNSTFTETPGSLRREKRPTARLHPGDCAALGVGEGDRVRIGNDRGEVLVHVAPRAGQQRGVVIVEGIWPNRHFANGIGINALTSSEPGYPRGGAVFHDTAVWIRRA
jgi:anaerobic selenocysteine-containing dehydrogenase